MTSPSVPKMVDDYVAARAARLSKQQEVNKLEIVEKKAKQALIDHMLEKETWVVGSKKNSVKLAEEDKPVASDWGQIYDFIKEHDAFDLLQRRLGEGAVKSRWEDDIEIPGITTFPVHKLSISKV